MLFILASLIPSLAFAGQLICEDPAQTIRMVAELPAGVNLASPAFGLELDNAYIELDASHNRPARVPLREAAIGGAQWHEASGGIAMRGKVSNTLVSFRIQSWNEKGEGLGRFENGSPGQAPYGSCRYEE